MGSWRRLDRALVSAAANSAHHYEGRLRSAFDNNWLRANLNKRGAAAVIPSKADRAGRIPHDAAFIVARSKMPPSRS